MFLYQFRCSRCSKPFLRPLFSVRQSQYRCKSTRNHYDVLGVPYNASQDQIKTAFIKKTKEFHPDRNSNTGSTKKFVEINDANMVLGNPKSRKEYDMQMKNSGHPYYRDAFRDSADPFDRQTGFYYRENNPRDIPYWQKDPFREDFGYQYEHRKRMREWAAQMERERRHSSQPIDDLYLYIRVMIRLFGVFLLAFYFNAYTNHPERFKWKEIKDREKIEFLDRRLAEREEASRNNEDIDVVRDLKPDRAFRS